MRAFFLSLIIAFILFGCGEIRYGSIRTNRSAHPGDDQNCLTEFSPRETPFCNNP
jgi:hypothetical protein